VERVSPADVFGLKVCLQSLAITVSLLTATERPAAANQQQDLYHDPCDADHERRSETGTHQLDTCTSARPIGVRPVVGDVRIGRTLRLGPGRHHDELELQRDLLHNLVQSSAPAPAVQAQQGKLVLGQERISTGRPAPPPVRGQAVTAVRRLAHGDAEREDDTEPDDVGVRELEGAESSDQGGVVDGGERGEGGGVWGAAPPVEQQQRVLAGPRTGNEVTRSDHRHVVGRVDEYLQLQFVAQFRLTGRDASPSDVYDSHLRTRRVRRVVVVAVTLDHVLNWHRFFDVEGSVECDVVAWLRQSGRTSPSPSRTSVRVQVTADLHHSIARCLDQSVVLNDNRRRCY